MSEGRVGRKQTLSAKEEWEGNNSVSEGRVGRKQTL